MKFEIIKADIVNVAADAIVLPANEALREGSGTSRAIFAAAGRQQLTKACRELGHCSTGSSVPTLAFDLDARYIIHAAVPKWIDGNHNEYNLLGAAYAAALHVADVMGCESIAFPLLAAGNNGFDKGLAVHIAGESIAAFEGENLKKVFLIAHSDSTVVLMKGLGYEVAALPGNDPDAERRKEHRARQKQLLAEGKEVALTFLEDRMAEGLEWIKKPENQQKVLDAGVFVFQLVVKKRIPGKR